MSPSKSILLQKLFFLYKFVQSPRTVGSITPSSFFLTKEMMKNINWGGSKSIVELGAGTGCFTNQIQRNKTEDCKVLIFELDEGMRNLLQKRFPLFEYYKDAIDLQKGIKENGLSHVDCIVSGLPFTNFSPQLREGILNNVEESLKPGGVFISFQYSLHMRRSLERKFSKVDISFVPLNVPPAFVYCCYK